MVSDGRIKSLYETEYRLAVRSWDDDEKNLLWTSMGTLGEDFRKQHYLSGPLCSLLISVLVILLDIGFDDRR